MQASEDSTLQCRGDIIKFNDGDDGKVFIHLKATPSALEPLPVPVKAYVYLDKTSKWLESNIRIPAKCGR